MKEGWAKVQLVEVLKFKSGKHLSAKFMNSKGIIPVVGGNGIAGYHNKANLTGENVIIGRVGANCGNVHYFKEELWLTDNAFKVIDESSLFDFKFLSFLLMSKRLNQFARSSAQPVISNSALKGVTISFPTDKSEQAQIVALLDKAFAEIDRAKTHLEQNIRNAEELFQSRLNELFHQQGPDWEEKKLGEVCKIESKLVNPTDADQLNKLHVGGGNIQSGTGRIIGLKTAKEEGLTSAKYSFSSENVVLYNKIRPYLKKVALPDFNGLCSADMYPLTVNPFYIDREYLYFLLISESFTRYAEAGSDRAGIPKVNRKHLFAYNFLLPNLKQQKKAVEILNVTLHQTNNIISNYQTQNQSLEELKQSLLERAFAGELS